MIDTRTAPYAALLLRVSAGVLFIAHALLKYLVFTMPGTVKFFDSVGFAGWLAYPVVAVELIGGIMLVLGVSVRYVAVILGIELLFASSVHWNNGWPFNGKGGGWEYPVFWAIAMFVLALLGDGAYSLGRSGRKQA